MGIRHLAAETYIPNPENKTFICRINNKTLNILVMRRV